MNFTSMQLRDRNICPDCGKRFRPPPPNMVDTLYAGCSHGSPFTVAGMCIPCQIVRVTYVLSGLDDIAWKVNRLQPYKGDAVINQKEVEKKMKTLYEIKLDEGVVAYGEKLTVNSHGKWVMELKGGNGEVISVDKTLVTEVRPYTVNVRYVGNPKVYSFFAAEGQFAVDDLVWLEDYNTLGVITAVGTKGAATKVLSGWIMSGKYVAKADIE